MTEHLRCCNGTYVRDAHGWHYPWGDPVPGATDLTLADLDAAPDRALFAEQVCRFRPLTPDEQRWLAGAAPASDEVFVRPPDDVVGPDVSDLVVGMLAPELDPDAMMTMTDIAEAAGASKATIDSHRYRGCLPSPQASRGRTPLWARPVVERWLAEHPEIAAVFHHGARLVG